MTVCANLLAFRDAKNSVAGNVPGRSAPSSTARITTRVELEHIIWEIWNNGFIPADVQKRVFQRHFSTKATFGRGLGTFSMKLFGEHYLKGKVSFDSSESNGTTFRFRLPRN